MTDTTTSTNASEVPGGKDAPPAPDHKTDADASETSAASAEEHGVQTNKLSPDQVKQVAALILSNEDYLSRISKEVAIEVAKDAKKGESDGVLNSLILAGYESAIKAGEAATAVMKLIDEINAKRKTEDPRSVGTGELLRYLDLLQRGTAAFQESILTAWRCCIAEDRAEATYARYVFDQTRLMENDWDRWWVMPLWGVRWRKESDAWQARREFGEFLYHNAKNEVETDMARCLCGGLSPEEFCREHPEHRLPQRLMDFSRFPDFFPDEWYAIQTDNGIPPGVHDFQTEGAGGDEKAADTNFGDTFDTGGGKTGRRIPQNWLSRWETDHVRRIAVEDCVALTTGMLRAKGLFTLRHVKGSLSWARPDCPLDRMEMPFLWLHEPGEQPTLILEGYFEQDGNYLRRDQRIDLTPYQLQARGCGVEWRFACPRTQQGVKKLFLPPGEFIFASKQGHNLCHRSQLLSRKQRLCAKREAAERVRQQQAQA